MYRTVFQRGSKVTNTPSPRSFADYVVCVDTENLPAGITVTER